MNRVLGGEVLELHDRFRKARDRGLEELREQRIVRRTTQARLRQSGVERVAAQRFPIRPDIEGHRETPVWMNPGKRHVQIELADRDAHPVGPKVAKTEDPLAVSHDDHAHIGFRPVGEDVRDSTAILRADVQPAGPAENVTELLAGLSDRWCVHDRHEPLDILDQQAEKEGFIPVLKAREEDVSVEVPTLVLEVLPHAIHLLVKRHHSGRQQSPQAKRGSLGFRKGRALVESGILQ